MSSMWMLGRFWAPPKTVIRRLLTAWLVRMFTVKSRRRRGEYPQTVAGRNVSTTKPGARASAKTSSHIALYLE